MFFFHFYRGFEPSRIKPNTSTIKLVYLFTPYNRLSGQQMLSGTQIISTSHGMTGTKYKKPYCYIWYANFSFVVQQIRHKFKIQKVEKMKEKHQRNSYLSFCLT
jgi:hypothetical protein